MSPFRLFLIAALCVSSLACTGARAGSGAGSFHPGPDAIAPHIVSVRADAASGVYGASRTIGLFVNVSERVHGTLVAHLSTGADVRLSCEGSACAGRYRVREGDVAEQLEVLYFTGALADVDGFENSELTVPAGANVADYATLTIGREPPPPPVPVEAPPPAPTEWLASW